MQQVQLIMKEKKNSARLFRVLHCNPTPSCLKPLPNPLALPAPALACPCLPSSEDVVSNCLRCLSPVSLPRWQTLSTPMANVIINVTDSSSRTSHSPILPLSLVPLPTSSFLSDITQLLLRLRLQLQLQVLLTFFMLTNFSRDYFPSLMPCFPYP